MRLKRLNLVRYGHFSDHSIELPLGNSDFHIIFGPNEAGKSTALAAIEDLLFGIPGRSPYNFIHDYKDMRIGGVLENGHETLEILRRKGMSDTLLNPDGLPISGGEGALRPYLAGVDGNFFRRMFSLDHVRLEMGGRDILDAKDDVGQILFSAGAGILGLRDQLGELTTEADSQWGPRRAQHRKFYQVNDKFEAAAKELREHTLTASHWRNSKNTYEEADATYVEVYQNIKYLTAQNNRLNRIRRVLRAVRSKQNLDRQIEKLSNVVRLPEDSAEVLNETERSKTKVTAELETLVRQLEQAQVALGELDIDDTLVQRANDIQQLNERRVEIRSEKADLPKREAELKASEETMLAEAKKLGWPESCPTALIDKLPPVNKVAVVRGLLNQQGELEAHVVNSRQQLVEIRNNHRDLSVQLDTIGKVIDVSRLAILIRTVREQGDLTERVRIAEQNRKSKQVQVDHHLVSLNPTISEVNNLATLVVPTRTEVESFRDREDDGKTRFRGLTEQISATQQELDTALAALEHTTHTERTITIEELNDSREHRDALWNLVKLKYVNGEDIPENLTHEFSKELKNLASAFEVAMAAADQLTDWRFDNAEALGRVGEINRKITELKIRLEQLHQREKNLVAESRELESEWESMWKNAPFKVRSAGAMLEWLANRKTILQVIAELRQAESDLTIAENEQDEAKQQVLGELEAIGIETKGLRRESLSVVIERARDEQHHQETAATRKSDVETAIRNAANESSQRERQLQQAEQKLDKWRHQWSAALKEIGLADTTLPEAVDAQINTIDAMRTTANRIRSLKHERIEKIKRDVVDFERVVKELVVKVAPDLSSFPAEDTVLELNKRLDTAQQLKQRQQEKNEEVASLTTQIGKLQHEIEELNSSTSYLMNAAGVATQNALKEAIENSDRKRSLDHERQQIIEAIVEDGDGKSLEELETECEDISMDDVVAQENSIQLELEDLRKQQTSVVEARSQAREVFEKIGGHDVAAQAAANKEAALAEMQETAEHYIRVKTAATLLRWVIERYRQEKQAPLLQRTSKLFQGITEGSFTDLRVDYDEQDTPYLTGIRPNGESVPVSGMSTGTSDQLYLALRIGAVENYLAQTHALPFVADDLFINFDDSRAAAGLKLLECLSTKTQVLFFTHHQHLVDIAQQVLASSVNLVSLNTQQETTD